MTFLYLHLFSCAVVKKEKKIFLIYFCKRKFRTDLMLYDVVIRMIPMKLSMIKLASI